MLRRVVIRESTGDPVPSRAGLGTSHREKQMWGRGGEGQIGGQRCVGHPDELDVTNSGLDDLAIQFPRGMVRRGPLSSAQPE